MIWLDAGENGIITLPEPEPGVTYTVRVGARLVYVIPPSSLIEVINDDLEVDEGL